jgi:hypothetical protein
VIVPHRRGPLSRQLGGVLAGAALSSLAVATSVVVIWVNRDSSGGDSGVLIVIAAAVSVPAFLLGATSLILLSGRTRNVKIVNTATALAVFVSLIPMGLIFLREVWAAFAFSFLFAVLVALVLTEPTERVPAKAIGELSVLEHPEPSESAPSESPQPISAKDGADAVPALAVRLPRPWQRRLSRGSSAIGRQAGDRRRAGRRERVRHMTLRHRHKEDAVPLPELLPAAANEAAPLPQGPVPDSSRILDAFLERMESGLERFERALAGHAEQADEILPMTTEAPAPDASGDAEERSADERLALLYAQIEAATRRLDVLIEDVDSRFKEWLAASRNGHTGMTASEPHAGRNAFEVLRSVQDDVASLVSGLDGGGPASGGLEAQLAAIRNLRMRLAKYVERSSDSTEDRR